MAVYKGIYLGKNIKRLTGTRVIKSNAGSLRTITSIPGKRCERLQRGVAIHGTRQSASNNNTLTSPRQEPLEISWKSAIFGKN